MKICLVGDELIHAEGQVVVCFFLNNVNALKMRFYPSYEGTAVSYVYWTVHHLDI